jgi:uncharacterized repeat protein (TIGR01451 family)
MTKFWRNLFFLTICSLMGLISTAQAQIIYGVGQAGTTTLTAAANSTALFTVSPTTGAATQICALADASTASTVSSLDGQVYYFSRPTVNLYKINPATCVNTLIGPSTVPTPLRATHCPDGRMYAASNTNQFFEVSSTTGATLRTLTWVGLPAVGSGDFSCATNGNLYVVAPVNITTASTTYALYSIDPGFSSVASGSNVTATLVGTTLFGSSLPANTNTFNSLSEAPAGTTGCAPSPTPCLVANNITSNQIMGINVTSGLATNIAGSGAALTDLGRSFPVNLSVSKTVTPTVALQGQTVVYVLNVSNPGPAVVQSVTVTDTLSPGISTATWACSVQTAGTPTLLTTACGVPSGSGNINNTVSLSIGGTVRFTITATLSSTFSGTLTNVGQATMSSLVTNPTPANNLSTVTSTVTPAINLGVTKTDGITTTVAGGTTVYTVTFTNSGPANGTGSVVFDSPGTGLSNCTVTSCTPTGAAVCPTPIANLLVGPGATMPNFPAGTSVAFRVSCRVSATGF